jgi:hypothetical protein
VTHELTPFFLRCFSYLGNLSSNSKDMSNSLVETARLKDTKVPFYSVFTHHPFVSYELKDQTDRISLNRNAQPKSYGVLGIFP